MSRESPSAEAILSNTPGPIVLFDGVCNLCNGFVRFVVRRDEAGRVSFAPLESPVGRTLCARFGLSATDADSVVVIEDGTAYRKSTAALRLARYLDGPWSLAARLRVVPRPLRDAIYDLVAASRYQVFGKKDRCPIPDPGTRERFLDGSFADRDVSASGRDATTDADDSITDED